MGSEGSLRSELTRNAAELAGSSELILTADVDIDARLVSPNR